MKKIHTLTGIAALATLSLTTATQAAIITWEAATAVSTTNGNSSDVSLDGTFHHAVAGEFSSSSGTVSDHTVNTVLFTGVGGGNGGSNDLWDGGDSGDATYNALLSEANFGLGGSSVTITLGDVSALGGVALLDGQDYQLQLWFVDDNTTGRTMIYGDGEASPSTVSLLGTNGQYAIGTFTASGTTQDLTLVASGFGQAHLSAMQLRAVPEPGTYALIGGLLALSHVMLRRRR
jgi:hypothetical protein